MSIQLSGITLTGVGMNNTSGGGSEVPWSDVRSLLTFNNTWLDSKTNQTLSSTASFSSTSKFGSASASFNGSTSVTQPFSPVGYLAGVNTTWEAFINPSTNSISTDATSQLNGYIINSNYTASAVKGRWRVSICGVPASGSTNVYRLSFLATLGTGNWVTRYTTVTANTNQWSHIAVGVNATTPASPTIYLSVNGVTEVYTDGFVNNGSTIVPFDLSDFSAANGATTDNSSIGGPLAYHYGLTGLIDEYRLSRYIVYPSNYTVPTAPFPTS